MEDGNEASTRLSMGTSPLDGQHATLISSRSKVDVPDYPPPPPFVPLTQSNYISQLPSILHSFFSSRLNGEKGLQDDGEFDPARAQIGPLGQIISKNPVTVPGPRKKEVKENGDALVREKKLSVKKVV